MIILGLELNHHCLLIPKVVANGDHFDASYVLLNDGFGRFEETTTLKNSSNLNCMSAVLADVNQGEYN